MTNTIPNVPRERASFEAAMRKVHKGDIRHLDSWEGGGYYVHHIQEMWELWNAAPVAKQVVMPERATADNTCADPKWMYGWNSCLDQFARLNAADHIEPVRAMVVPKCKCSMSISVLGDGCRYCQPQEYIDRIHDQMEDDRAMVVPDGWKLVPVDATEEILEVLYHNGIDEPDSLLRDIWAALLAASSAPGDSK